MGATTAIQQKPFINHVSQAFLESREGLDKTTKLVINTLELARWGLDFSDSTSSVGDTLGTIAKEMKYVRSVIKLVDIFDSVKIPKDPLEGFDLGLHVTQSAASGAAGLIEIAGFLNDVNAIEIGKAAYPLAQVANGLVAVSLSANLVGDFRKLSDENTVIQHSKDRLTEILFRNPVGSENGHPTLSYTNGQNALEGEYRDTTAHDYMNSPAYRKVLGSPESAAEVTVNDQTLVKGTDYLKDLVNAKIEQKRTILDIAQTIFEISAVVFAFVVATLLLPLVIAVPVLATLGIASATTGLWKLWSQTSDKPKIVDLADYYHSDTTRIPAGRFMVNLDKQEVLDLRSEGAAVAG